MTEKNNGPNVGTYRDFREGLSVKVPGRTDVKIVRKPFGSPLQPQDEAYKIIRPLVNFAIEDPKSKQGEPFKQAFEILVRFTEDDLAGVGGESDKLVFICYKDDQEGWVEPKALDENAAVERYRFTGSEGFVGFDVIKLSFWPADPGNGWGGKQ